MSVEEANEMMANDPDTFKDSVQSSLRRHAASVNAHTAKGTYFFDYGNAFLLEASRAGGEVMAENGIDFKYPSYVQDIMGPMCFDYGDGFVHLEKQKIFKKQMRLPVKYLSKLDNTLLKKSNNKWRIILLG